MYDLIFKTGGFAQLGLYHKELNDYVSHNKEKNHLYVLENMLREMIPPYGVKKCDLSASITNHGNISLILEAVNPGDHQLCRDALQSITNSIKNGHRDNFPRKFEMAAFLSLDSWFRDQVVEVQNQIINAAGDLGNQANVKLREQLVDVDERIQRLPSRGEKARCVSTIIMTVTVSLLLYQAGLSQ